MLVVAREDVEEGHALTWKEASSYVKIYPLPTAEINSQHDTLQPETNHKGKRIIYVENALTGELVPVLADAPDAINYDDLDGSDSNTYDDNELTPLVPLDGDKANKKTQKFGLEFSETINLYLRVAFLFIQGILAGFSFTTLYFQTTADPVSKTSQFLVLYTPLAGEIRRYFFILTTISFIGSIDTLMTIYNESSNAREKFLRSIRQKKRGYSHESDPSKSIVSAFVVCALHLICFITSLRMAVDDTIISIRPSHPLPLDTWSSLNSARYVCAVLAWIGCCQIMFADLYEKGIREKEISRLKDVCLYWKNRSEDLCGEGPRVAVMGAGELQALNRMQKVLHCSSYRLLYLIVLLFV